MCISGLCHAYLFYVFARPVSFVIFCIRCPVPTCKSARRKAKPLRPLPAKLQELPSDVRDRILSEMRQYLISMLCFKLDRLKICVVFMAFDTRVTRGPWINNYIPEDWPRSLMIMLSKISILLLHAQAYGVIMCRWPVKPQVGRYWYAELYQLVKAYRITKFLVSRSQ